MKIKQKVADLLRARGVDLEGALFEFSPKLDVAAEKQTEMFPKKRAKDSHLDMVVITPEAVGAMIGKQPGKDLVRIDQRGMEIRGLTRSDLAAHDMIALTAHFENEQVLRTASRFLSADDWYALSVSMTAKRYLDANQPEKAQRLREGLRRKLRERGNRIFNFYTTGLFDEYIMPVLVWVEFTPTRWEIEHARKIWDLCLEHMANAIYVSSTNTVEEIVKQIRYRFGVDGVQIVILFGMGDKAMKTIGSAIDDLTALDKERQVSRPEFTVSNEVFKFGELRSVMSKITRKKTPRAKRDA